MASSNLQVFVLFTISVLIVIGVIGYSNWGFLPSASASQDMMSVFPGILLTFVGLGTAGGVKRSLAIVGACGVAGLGLALLLDELNAAGIILVANLGGWSIYSLQMLIIVGAFVFGAVVYFKR